MCTNRDLVNTMECYMDTLIESFQDFVNKSLVMMSVGACTVVAMLIYVMKFISERRVPVIDCSTSLLSCTDIPKVCSVIPKICPSVPKVSSSNVKNCSSIPKVSSSFPKVCARRRSDVFLKCKDNMTCASVTCDLPLTPSQDERVLNEFRFSNCIKDLDIKKRGCCAGTSARISIPSIPTFMPSCISKQTCPSAPPKHCPRNLIRASCCSLCCNEDKKHYC